MAPDVRMLIGLLLVLLAAATAWIAAAWALQRAALYPRPSAPAVSPAEGRTDVEVVRLGSDGVEGWFLPPEDDPAPALIFTHGNGELIDYWLQPFERTREWGVGVLLLEYPGYGRSGGSPSEASIIRAMEAAYDYLAERPDVDEQRIVAWGRSLGGGAASALAGRRPVAALVLESSFTGVRPLARRFGLPGALVRDPFDNLSAVRTFSGPVLVIHGERDSIIPAEHGRELAAAAPAAELHLLPCGHNDCPTQWAVVRRFLERGGLLR